MQETRRQTRQLNLQPGSAARTAGDTLMIDELHEIRRRHPSIDLALLHLGGTMVLASW